MTKLIGTSDFVTRQTVESRFTHFGGTREELEDLTELYFEDANPGYKEGVLLVPVPPRNFFRPGPYTVGKTYNAIFEPRREGEEPVMQIHNDDEKIQCKHVDIILYHKDVLDEDNDRSTASDWEIISINGKEADIEEPIHPIPMARNQLHLTGGTKADYTAEEFAKAILYWNKRSQ